MVYSVARCLMIAAAVLGLLASPASALTTYYVDPSWTGSQTGAAATPWTSLAASGAWSTVNTRLATDDVEPGTRCSNSSTWPYQTRPGFQLFMMTRPIVMAMVTLTRQMPSGALG